MLNTFKDHLIEAQLLKDEKLTRLGFLITGIVILLLVADIIYLNSILFQTHSSSLVTIEPSPGIAFIPSEAFSPTPTINRISPTSPPILTQAISPYVTRTQNTSVKDYYVPLGSGTNQSGDWEDVVGAQAIVDFGQYSNIKEIRFEASVTVPTANQSVWVRLYNKTDKHPVWLSDVAMGTNSSAYLTSSPIAYDTGEKLYQVQMKTQLQATANLTQARIHITLQ